MSIGPIINWGESVILGPKGHLIKMLNILVQRRKEEKQEDLQITDHSKR